LGGRRSIGGLPIFSGKIPVEGNGREEGRGGRGRKIESLEYLCELDSYGKVVLGLRDPELCHAISIVLNLGQLFKSDPNLWCVPILASPKKQRNSTIAETPRSR